jgi:hypothetical protein
LSNQLIIATIYRKKSLIIYGFSPWDGDKLVQLLTADLLVFIKKVSSGQDTILESEVIARAVDAYWFYLKQRMVKIGVCSFLEVQTNGFSKPNTFYR